MPKTTTITSQVEGIDKLIVVFKTLQEAKDWFYTKNAQKCSAEYCIKVEYALQKDHDGNNTKLKRTEEWALDGSAQVYNNRKIELIGLADWNTNNYHHETSDDHLF
jgi:hypothetical protein